MRKIQLILIIIICAILLIMHGCNKNTKINEISTYDELIDNKSRIIDTIVCSNFNKNILIKDEETVNKIMDIIKNISIEEITPHKENKIIENKKYNYTLTFISNNDIIGATYITTNNQILLYNSHTLTSNKRSIAYLNTKNYNNEINEIIQIIENRLESNDELIEAVKEIERLDHQFSNYFLPYDEYISSLKGLDIKFNASIDDEEHYNRKYVPEPIDLKNFDKEQLDKLRKTQGNLCDVKVEISKVFDYENKKYIFTKSTISPKDNSAPGFCITKRYRLSNNNGKYEIEYIDIGMYDIDTPEENMKYNKFNNEFVEYSEQYKPLK